ncbi:MAG: hypothetical protein IT337_10770 [Thermomicrobiales bacterium]|nr:hypothetical protein [Thermomicrobiales bacterium]
MSASTGAIAYAPRRLRNHVCPHLRIDGEAVSLPQVRAWRARQVMATIALAIRGRQIACLVRPGVKVPAAFVDDICASSWGRSCPFLPAEGEP